MAAPNRNAELRRVLISVDISDGDCDEIQDALAMQGYTTINRFSLLDDDCARIRAVMTRDFGLAPAAAPHVPRRWHPVIHARRAIRRRTPPTEERRPRRAAPAQSRHEHERQHHRHRHRPHIHRARHPRRRRLFPPRPRRMLRSVRRCSPLAAAPTNPAASTSTALSPLAWRPRSPCLVPASATAIP